MTDRQREALVADMLAALPHSRVPTHLHAGLLRYFSDGIMPGSFLQAVLCNDLIQTVGRSDFISYSALGFIVAFLLAHAPANAWGSREAVLAWSTTPDRLEI